jgi:hypothetical protein
MERTRQTMAKDNVNQGIKLPLEMKAQLERLDADIRGAENGLNALRKLGMDVGLLQDRLNFAKEARKVLLDEFS